MKQYLCTALALLLAASMFTGCGCTNRNVSNQPEGMITDPTNVAPSTNPMPTMTTPPTETTMPHRETTEPTHDFTEPGMTDGTLDTQPGTGESGDTGETGPSMPSDPARSRGRSIGR